MAQQQPLHVSGSKFAPDIKTEDSSITNAMKQLKYELAVKQTESRRLADQLNCLISLIKRSWTGDKHATVHLSNIVGMEPPECFDKNDETADLGNSEARHPSPLPKRELREYQQQYMENRQAYMDAVLQDHQQIMATTPLHHKSEPAAALGEMDSKFLQYTKSAGHRKKVSYNDATKTMEGPPRNLDGDNMTTGSTILNQTLNEPRTPTQSANNRHPLLSGPTRQLPPNTYSDPERYAQENLFTPNESDGVRRPRPVSSSSLKAGDIIRSRPRSGRTFSKSKPDNQAGKPVFTAQKHERPLKYETTRPAGCKPKSANRRGRSADGFNRTSSGEVRSVLLTDIISASSKALAANGHGGDLNNSNENFPETRGSQDVVFPHEKSFEDYQSFHAGISGKPPSAVRVKSAFQRRPGFIDEFAKDEQARRDMEDDFRRTALSLQKRLGIADSAMVI